MTPKAKLLWEYGLEYQAGPISRLVLPVSAHRTRDHLTIIADRGRDQVVALSALPGREAWTATVPGLRWAVPVGDEVVVAVGRELRFYDAGGASTATVPLDLSPDFVGPGRGDRLIVVDTDRAVCAEIDRRGRVRWSSPRSLALRQPRSAVLRRDGSYLIVDDAANWVVAVAPGRDQVVWQFGTRGRGSRDLSALFSPKHAIESAAGVLVADSYNNRVVEIHDDGTIAWQHGIATEPGSEPGRLWRPTSVAETAAGTILIADSKNRRVLEVDRMGRTVGSYGHAPVRRSRLRLPRSIAMCAGRSILIANTHADELTWIDVHGRPLRSWSGDPAHMYWPRSATPRGDRIMVCDGRHDRVLELRRRDGVLQSRPWLERSDASPIEDPHHLAPTRRGWLLASTGNHRVYRVSRDGRDRVSLFPDGVLNDPHFACEARDGAILVADTGNARVLIVDPSGEVVELSEWTSPERRVRLRGPRQVTELDDGRLLVVDTTARALVCGDRRGRLAWVLDRPEDVAPGARPFYVDGSSFCYDPRWVHPVGDGRLLVGDTGNNRVFAIQLDASTWRGLPQQRGELRGANG